MKNSKVKVIVVFELGSSFVFLDNELFVLMLSVFDILKGELVLLD